ncbi:MAG: SCP2 sterol-binding domain-containing protein [Chromatiaceae bacterium]|nr:SCP2 sterol-binding domain-containing protein [Chromatiaceae bacterium]
MQIPDAALAALEGLINRYLALDPEGARRLAALQGRVFLIEVTGFGTPIYLIPGPDSIQLFGEYAGEPDCTLRGSPAALARLGLSRRREDQLFGGEVEVEGQTDLAQELGDLLGGIEVDWEEQLSRLVGDPLAHQVGSGLRSAGRWGRQTTETLTQDLGEYLQEEARLLPSRNEVEAFLDDVDRLRDDVERLAARMGRLAKGHGDGGGEQ